MKRKLMWLALMAFIQVIVEVAVVYITKTQGPLFFKVRFTPDVDLMS